ncbi:prolyl oligopeptidase family serine peptidase [Fimbriimonas ginsengisoli]|uniref:Dipeptidyl peptidase IV, putative n=1 Tax=Fimbriimonas ginsengisoli Gsoil 348 TaxID=661478 RepID=A0A068NRU3_FIMGI|nr:prolyl oligopeptidase family serine peptidase [Fimbriimonas ginsengisoli]AIE86151.1 dipeptidyl peptidase IV, putative [Fimbriimonas ginsengisoli Gsoil 348]
MPLIYSAAVFAALSFQQAVTTPTEPPLNSNPVIAAAESAAGLHLDDLYPRKPFFGRGATGSEWSKDNRYLAYVWAPYDTKGGSDLYIYDAQEHKTTRLTSPEVMGRFDRDIAKAVERYKKETDEEARMLRMNDLEFREWRLKRKEEDEKRKEPLPSYPGVGELEWSPKGHDLLFTWKGDVFRTNVAESKLIRLTRTKESENGIKWLPNAEGYTFQRSGGVFRVRFDTGAMEQLNPELPTGVSYTGYSLSPDGTKLMVTGSKPGPQSRMVDYISYRERFAQAKKAEREVADDPFSGEAYVYIYDLTQDSLDEVKGEGKPWEVWKWPGGKEWQQTAVNDQPWSPDSKRLVFGTWRRTAREQEIIVADTEKKTLKSIYKGKPDGEMNTPGMADPFFTKDGNQVIALLDTSGFRHAWLLDPATEGATPLTKGDFEVYPVKQSADGKTLIVTAQKEDSARMDVYRVEIASGAMERMTHREGNYGRPAVSDDGSRLATTFVSWDSPSELYVLDGGREEKITDSHRVGAFEKINTLKPKLFTYKNRNGQTIHGFMFLPPGWKKSDRRPLMIYVYGGPLGTSKSVEVGAFNSSAYLFNMYLAKVFGYVTVTIDPRGQSGYGNVFGKANYEQPGKAQVEDLTDGVKYLVSNFGVDSKKVAVNGWSFGGFQTQMCMYTAPDVFTLGIAGAGPTEWQNYNNWYSTGTIGPVPNAKPDDLDKYSLTYLAKNLRSPLLLLHGMEDTNVLFQDTIKVYRKLLQYGRGPLVELAFDPTGSHGLGGDIDTRDRHAIYLGFINKWWGPYRR